MTFDQNAAILFYELIAGIITVTDLKLFFFDHFFAMAILDSEDANKKKFGSR